MKKLCLVYTVLLLLPIAGRGQVLLNPGDSYTFVFTNFSYAGTVTTTSPGVSLSFSMNGVEGTEGLMLEVFENNTSEAPLVTVRDIRLLLNPVRFGNAWSDRQGVVRFTVTSGSVALNGVFASIVYPNGEVYEEFFQIIVTDNDDDGVMDHEDQCLDTPRGAVVDEHGCTLAPLATTIVAETGANAFGWAARTDQFMVVSWTQTNAYRDVNVGARLYSLALADPGTAYLMTRIGPGTTAAEEVAVASFTFPNAQFPSAVLLFSGLTLGPGTYYLIVAGGTSFWSAWYGSREPNVIADGGVTHNGNFYVTDPAAYAPASVIHPHSTAFQIFAVNGTRMPANRPPVANAGADQRIECSGTATSVLLDGRESRDLDGDVLSYTWREGATQLGVGSTLSVDLTSGPHNIRLVVTDTSGSSAEDNVLVHIEDTTAPHIEASASPEILWPPNGKMVPVAIEAEVLDACDLRATARIVGVESDEPSSGITDWEITGALTLKLRARRLGTGQGRTYRVTVEGADASGNTARRTVSIFVPR